MLQLLTESEVAIMLYFQLCSAHYTALQTRSASEINLENADDSHLATSVVKPSCPTTNQHLAV